MMYKNVKKLYNVCVNIVFFNLLCIFLIENKMFVYVVYIVYCGVMACSASKISEVFVNDFIVVMFVFVLSFFNCVLIYGMRKLWNSVFLFIFVL